MSEIFYQEERVARIRDLVKDPEWQRLRKSLVGTWKKTPAENCQKLREFLGGEYENWTDNDKLRIVRNYLTGSGFRAGVIRHPEISRLLRYVRQKTKRVKQFDKHVILSRDEFSGRALARKVSRTQKQCAECGAGGTIYFYGYTRKGSSVPQWQDRAFCSMPCMRCFYSK